MDTLSQQILDEVQNLTGEVLKLYERLESIEELLENSNGESAPQDRLLSVHETAHLLNCSPKTIYNSTSPKSEEKFPIPFKRVRGRIKFHLSDVQEYLKGLKDE